jgi:hypothetical protein
MAEQELVIVFDESVSYRIGNAFAAFCIDYPGLTIKSMKSGTKDRDWLDGEFPIDPPHVVIARDSVLRPSGQLRAWVRGGLTVVIIDDRLGNIAIDHLAAHLFRWWPTILATARGSPRQAAFAVPVKFVNRARLPKWNFKGRRRRVAGKRRGTKKQKAALARRRDDRQGDLDV